MKKTFSLFLLLTKSTLLVLMSSMSFWGVSVMAMPDCHQVMDEMGCQICELAEEKWSEPLIRVTEEVAERGYTSFVTIPEKTLTNWKLQTFEISHKIIPKAPFNKNSYLFSKAKIVLIV